MEEQRSNVSELLAAWGLGDRAALDALIPIIHAELRRIAANQMMGERPGHSLQATALVNEVYLRLVDQRAVKFQNRAHFFAIAARLMRRILVDSARSSGRKKRGGGVERLALDDVVVVCPEPPADLLALDDALERLALVDARKAQVVELRYFGGLSVEDCAQALSISENTVIRDWAMARAWLLRELDANP